MLLRSKTWITINAAQPGDVLRILVENQGRDNIGGGTYNHLDYKGLHNGVTLDGINLHNWFQCGINLTKASIDSLSTTFFEENRVPEKAASTPGVYVGQFTASQLEDTFFNSTGWGKGQIGRAVQQECRDRSRMPSSA
uniref:Beta-galactosidase 1-like first all-beta domain-containing protein n=1 Tax=Acrobeloides nanus TaxID=290746 RepID=A0A914DYR8_9BILA